MSIMEGDMNNKDAFNQWKNCFHLAEIIIHYKWNMIKVRNNTNYARRGEKKNLYTHSLTYQSSILNYSDYDIALVRISYPVLDEDSGQLRIL